MRWLRTFKRNNNGFYQDTSNIQNFALTGKFDKAVDALGLLIRKITTSKHNINNFYGSSDIDQLIELIVEIHSKQARPLEEKNTAESDYGTIALVTSFVLNSGGHTREILDFLREAKKAGQKAYLIVTGSPASSHKEALGSARELSTVVVLEDQPFSSKLNVLGALLSSPLLEQVIYFPCTSDIALLASIAMAPKTKTVILNLNVDHGYSPGLHIKRIDQIIVKRPLNHILLEQMGLAEKLTYLPFSRSPSGTKHYARSISAAPYASLSCTSARYKINDSYRFPYKQIVSNILATKKIRHIHVGAISKSQKRFIRKAVLENNLPDDYFIHIPYARRLADVFDSHGVDILLQTFPLGGGLVSIEAMEAGLAIINHTNSDSKLYNLNDFTYKGSLTWKDPADLSEIISNLSKSLLEEHKEISRAHYLEYNQPEIMTSAIFKKDYTGKAFDRKAIKKLYSYEVDQAALMYNSRA